MLRGDADRVGDARPRPGPASMAAATAAPIAPQMDVACWPRSKKTELPSCPRRSRPCRAARPPRCRLRRRRAAAAPLAPVASATASAAGTTRRGRVQDRRQVGVVEVEGVGEGAVDERGRGRGERACRRRSRWPAASPPHAAATAVTAARLAGPRRGEAVAEDVQDAPGDVRRGARPAGRRAATSAASGGEPLGDGLMGDGRRGHAATDRDRTDGRAGAADDAQRRHDERGTR